MVKAKLHRFRREAEIAAKLAHPNIVQIVDYNALPSGQPYLVMELLRGESLHARLKRGPLKLESLTRIVREAGAALETAHRAGVVHRDFKPENIFLVPTPTGDLTKVLDFGISKLDDGAPVKTSDSMIIGTPRYMSPEQAMGHNSTLTLRSDLYSLATVCFEALAGRPMFDSGNVAHLLYQIAQDPHPPLVAAIPGLPHNVARALEHALMKDPADRTPDAAAFVAEFTGHAPAAHGRLRPAIEVSVTATKEERAPVAKRPAALLAIIGLGLLLISAGIAFALSNRLASMQPLVLTPVRRDRPRAVTSSPKQVEPLADDEADADAGIARETMALVPAAVSKQLPVKPAAATMLITTEEDKGMMASLDALHSAENWGALMHWQLKLVALPKNSAARRHGLLLLLEASCALRETTVSASFNRIVSDYPELRLRAETVCHKHLPEYELNAR